MKITLKTGMMIMAVAILFTACTPEAHKEVGPPRNTIASLEGTWKLIKATQVDEDAAFKGFPAYVTTMDITTIYPYTDFVLKFNLNSGAPSTFTTTRGGSPAIIKLTGGNWAVDNPEYPKVITLTSGSTTEKATLGGYTVGPNNTLKLKVQRYDIPAPPTPPNPPLAPKLLITYIYEFAKQ
ncbi:MAG TPA: DUF5004 domain-containing protein [Chitinophagaceae bacterium]|jgi:hypothetical protein|nr:DUF5004 domain-containing protein [Chitinophagaceae bacterium]